MSYKSVILRFVPRFAHEVIRDAYFFTRLVGNCLYDLRRFLAFSGLNKSRGFRSERAARITLFYHQVEKGLSLAAPRPGFGMQVIPRLFDDVDRYVSDYGLTEPATTALAALSNYLQHHDKIGHDAKFVRERLAYIKKKYGIDEVLFASWQGGVVPVKREEIESAKRSGFRGFFESRYSIRQFAGGPIPLKDIETAVDIAQKTPSVCNRQAWKVHAYTGENKLAEVLEIQAGSRGFGDQASVVLAVTCELGVFVEVAERYQAWIDGGMFSMSLCLALHELGYGSCCLNWSKEAADDMRLRKVAGIPDSEQIIMLIAVGNLKDQFYVARSYRPPVETCLYFH